MDPRKLLVEQWLNVERVIAFFCRMHGLRGADAEDFASIVKVKLFENDCEIVRGFRGECKLATYLGVVVQRTAADLQVSSTGKWHASAAAVRLGPMAIELEELVYRSDCSPAIAFERLQARNPGISRAELESLFDQLPRRSRRSPPVPLDDLAESLSSKEGADVLVLTNHRRALTDRAARTVREFLARQIDRDRLMLQMHFESDLHLSQIAKILGTEQKPLYRRRERLLHSLRAELENAGITASEVADLIGHVSEESDFGLRQKHTDTRDARPESEPPEIPQ